MRYSNRRRPGLPGFAVAGSSTPYTQTRVPWSRVLAALLWILAVASPSATLARGEPP